MAPPAGILRYLRRKTGGLIFFACHVEEDTEALYGPNPNDITWKRRSGSPVNGRYCGHDDVSDDPRLGNHDHMRAVGPR
jgi:hypothetical protein